ncbi:MAG: FIVAR domain-containing protein [Prevotellaceae bacterium]|jgi:hypothetical protein|nr:FIVAR domain-containing protein [Prevotellaceae bacterium]
MKKQKKSKKSLSLAILFTAALCAQQLSAANSPEFQWGAVLRSNDESTTSGTNSPQFVKANAGGELFTLGTFTSHATNAYKYATYKHYDAAGALTERVTPQGALKTSTGANNNLFAYKHDTQGKVLWQVTSDRGDIAGSYSQITPTPDGGALLAVKVRFTNSNQFADDSLLQLIDNSGVKTGVKWTGYRKADSYQLVAAKISGSGQVEWVKHLIKVSDGESSDAIRVMGLEAGSDGCYYLGGWYADTITLSKANGDEQRLIPHNTKGDILLLKLDPNGSFLYSVEAEGTIASQGINSMTLHKSALYIYGNVKADTAPTRRSATLLGHTITPSTLDDNAYSARIDIDGANPTAKWVTLFNARPQDSTSTVNRGGRIKVTNINYDGGSVFLSGSFTGFIDKADGTQVLANDLATGATAAQLKAFIIRQDPYTGEVLGKVKDDSTGISEAYTVALRGSKVHAYGYTMSGTGVLNPSAWYRTYNADFTGETHQPLLAGGTAFDGLFLDSTLLALARVRNATSIPGVTGGIATEAPPAFSAYFLAFGIDELKLPGNTFDRLEKTIDSVKTLNPLNYTPGTWSLLQTAVAAAETLLTGAPSEQEASAAIDNIRSAKAGIAENTPEFQWGAIIKPTVNGNSTPTTTTQSITPSLDGNSVFTLSNFYTQKDGQNFQSVKAVYNHYDDEGTLITDTTPEGHHQITNSVTSTRNLLIHKLDKQGNVIWQLTSDRGDIDIAYTATTVTADSGLLLALKVRFSGALPPAAGSDSLFLRLVENDGVTKATLRWDYNPQKNTSQGVLVKVDANGHVLWMKHFLNVDDTPISNTTSGAASDAIYINGLEEGKDGSIYVAGRYVKKITFTTPGGDTKTLTPRNAEGWTGDSQIGRGDMLLAKLDPNGSYLWHLEAGGKLLYESLGAMTIDGSKLFVTGNMVATHADSVGIEYAVLQGDTVYPTEKYDAFVARFDVSGEAPDLQWLTHLKSRPAGTSGGRIYMEQLTCEGGELFLTGRFTGFVHTSDGKQLLDGTATQRGYVMRLNPTTGTVSGAAREVNNVISNYYRVAFRENRLYCYGYSYGTQLHTFNAADLSGVTSRQLFAGKSGTTTAWDAMFFNDQMITVGRAQGGPNAIAGATAGKGLYTESHLAYSSYILSHSFAGLQPQPNFRDGLEDTLKTVRIAYNDPGPYTTASWQTLQGALAGADGVLADPALLTGDAVEAAAANIRTAVNGLIVKNIGALLAELQDAVDSAKVKYPQDVYTSETWDTLQVAIARGDDLLGKPAEATEPELLAAISDLSGAVEGLVTKVLDNARQALAVLIDSAAEYSAAVYTAATHGALQSAVGAALPLLSDNAATVEQLEAAGENISNAINSLVTKVSAARLALQDTINAAQAAYDEATYTVATYAALQDSLAAAQALLDDGEEHTVAEYEAAGAAIGNAVGGLVTKLSAARLALQDAVENTRATYAQAHYTPASWDALQAALSAADAALSDPNAPVLADLVAAQEALDAAIAGLASAATGVSRVADGSVLVTARPSTIVVRGAAAGAAITVVNISGSVVYRVVSTGDVQEFTVSAGLYVVVAGSQAVKVAVLN